MQMALSLLWRVRAWLWSYEASKSSNPGGAVGVSVERVDGGSLSARALRVLSSAAASGGRLSRIAFLSVEGSRRESDGSRCAGDDGLGGWDTP